MKKVQVVVICKNQVLLLQTVREGCFWQNVTGSALPSESFYDAAKRELKEETGLDANLINLKKSFCYFKRCRFFWERLFLAVTDNKEIRISAEHIAYKWKNITEVSRLDYKYKSNYNAFLKGLAAL